jgi:hypothetical protein
MVLVGLKELIQDAIPYNILQYSFILNHTFGTSANFDRRDITKFVIILQKSYVFYSKGDRRKDEILRCRVLTTYLAVIAKRRMIV